MYPPTYYLCTQVKPGYLRVTQVKPGYYGIRVKRLATHCASIFAVWVWIEFACWLQTRFRPERPDRVVAFVTFEQVLSLPLWVLISFPLDEGTPNLVKHFQ